MYTIDFQNTNILAQIINSNNTYFMNRGIVFRALFTVCLNSFAISFDEYSFLISCEKLEVFYILFNLLFLQ